MHQEPVVVADPHAPVAPSKTVKISALKTLKARHAELELREGAEMPSGFDDMGLQKFAIEGFGDVIMRLAAPETPVPVVRASPRARPRRDAPRGPLHVVRDDARPQPPSPPRAARRRG